MNRQNNDRLFFDKKWQHLKKRNRRLQMKTHAWLLFVAAIIVAFFLLILIKTKRLKIVGKENVPPHSSRGVLLLSNHPSLFEPILIYSLFIPAIVKDACRYVPWIVADRGNFYDPWYCWLLRFLRIIPVVRSRDVGMSNLAAIRAMTRVLRGGGHLILFPEGTRTYKAVRRGEYYCSKTGKKMGCLREGVGMLTMLASPICVPIWVDGADYIMPPDKRMPRLWRLIKHSVTIHVGPQFAVDGVASCNEATNVVTVKLLELADDFKGT